MFKRNVIFDLYYGEKRKVSKPSGIPVVTAHHNMPSLPCIGRRLEKTYSFCEPCFLGLFKP